MVEQISLSPQVNQGVINANKLVYTGKLPHELPNDLGLWEIRKFGNVRKISKLHRIVA